MKCVSLVCWLLSIGVLAKIIFKNMCVLLVYFIKIYINLFNHYQSKTSN